jgi:hypothetical protein
MRYNLDDPANTGLDTLDEHVYDTRKDRCISDLKDNLDDFVNTSLERLQGDVDARTDKSIPPALGPFLEWHQIQFRLYLLESAISARESGSVFLGPSQTPEYTGATTENMPDTIKILVENKESMLLRITYRDIDNTDSTESTYIKATVGNKEVLLYSGRNGGLMCKYTTSGVSDLMNGFE